jgi:hypothetical protein
MRCFDRNFNALLHASIQMRKVLSFLVAIISSHIDSMMSELTSSVHASVIIVCGRQDINVDIAGSEY